MSTININENFPFDKIKLLRPKALQGGTYSSKLAINDNKPILIQTPKCKTKSGIHKTQKDIYCDLKFSFDSETFLNWIENLEETIRNLIYEKRNLWFHNDMDMDSIEYHWQNLLRIYKKNNKLLRCFIQKPKIFNGVDFIQIYDTQENKLTLDDFNKIFDKSKKNKHNDGDNTSLICILEVSELKFTSQSFILEINLRQVMVIKEKPIFNKCLINLNNLEDTNSENKNTIPVESKIKLLINEKNEIEKTIGETESESESDEEQQDEEQQNDNNSIQETNNVTLDISKNVKESDTETTETTENTENTENVKTTETSETSESTESTQTTETAETSENLEPENTQLSENNVDEKEVNKSEVNKTEITKNVTEEIDNLGKTLEKIPQLNEITLTLPENKDTLKIKPANEVYMEIYREARNRAKIARKNAIKAYLEAKKIKRTYLLDDLESSDDDLEEYADLFD